jgi:hypothetical protein
MYAIKRTLFMFSALFVLFVSAASAGYAQNGKPSPTPTPAPGPSDVNVVNTPSVTITNTPDVKIANAPDVKVTNTPRTLNANDLQPFQATQNAYAQGNVMRLTFTGVPQGKRLVIEYVSVLADIGLGEEAGAVISTVTLPNDTVTDHQILLSPQRTLIGERLFAGAQQIRMYHEGGSTFAIDVSRSNPTGAGPTGNMRAFATVTGYLVDVQ